MNLNRFPLGAPRLELLRVGADSSPKVSLYPFRYLDHFVYCWPGFEAWPSLDIVVPQGYETDLLSIPKPLWAVLSPFGEGAWGSGPHDLLYSSEYSLPGQSKEDARAMHDRILYDAALDSGCSSWKAWVIWKGVRLGGGLTWTDHNPGEVSDDLLSFTRAQEWWSRKWWEKVDG